MNMEDFKKDLEYYQAIMMVCKELKEHIWSSLDDTNIKSTLKRFDEQKDYGISNFVTYVVIEFMRSEKFKELPENEREHIQFLTTRKLQ